MCTDKLCFGTACCVYGMSKNNNDKAGIRFLDMSQKKCLRRSKRHLDTLDFLQKTLDLAFENTVLDIRREIFRFTSRLFAKVWTYEGKITQISPIG